MNLRFRKIDNDYPYDLLLQADHTREGIEEYLFDSRVYVALLEESEGRCVRNAPVGVMCLLRRSAHTIELMNIAVDEPLRGQGIGGGLIAEAVRIAAAEGYRELIVGTGTEDCACDQIRFYERHGFVKSSVRKHYFIEKYAQPIIENGVRLRDMQVLARPIPCRRR